MFAPELLAPAGNWDCARAALAHGADAIFFGLEKFNARLRADNFSNADLAELMQWLHTHGKKGYVTMNTLIFQHELPAAIEQLKLLEACEVDGVIVQDLGLARLVARYAPNLALHASTQMSLSSLGGLQAACSILPLKRAVLARELNVAEIEKISELGKLPVEVFVHGALCVAYSGQCLTSESLGQRSANRGECAQACRMPYKLVVDGILKDLGEVRYLLSPQDLAAVELVPDLIKAGVSSFKIEGRLKSPEYVAAVTRVYRKAIDHALQQFGNQQAPAAEQAVPVEAVNADDWYALNMTFSRGLSTGWLGGTNHPYLTHGRFGKKRGQFIGEITRCGQGWFEIEFAEGGWLEPEDGIVFDCGQDRNNEQGGRVWDVCGNRVSFNDRFSPINWKLIKPGYKIYKTHDPQLEKYLRKSWKNAKLEPLREALHLEVLGKLDEPLRLHCSRYELTLYSASPLQAALKQPLNHEVLERQLSRLGQSNYTLGGLQCQLEGDLMLPLSELNQMRRELVERIEACKLEQRQAKRREQALAATAQIELEPRSKLAEAAPSQPQLQLLVRNMPQLEAALEARTQSIYVDFEDVRRYREAMECHRSSGSSSKILLATPRIHKNSEDGILQLIAKQQPHGVLVRNLAALAYYQNSDLQLVGDFSLNIANALSAELLMEKFRLERLTISYDLNINQALSLLQATPPHWLELTLHQHMPMFHMEHCVFCTFLSNGTSYKDCGRPCETHQVELEDRVKQRHVLMADVGCRNTLFNARAQTAANYYTQLREAGLSNFRIELLKEDKQQALKLIAAYKQLLEGRISGSELYHNFDLIERLGVTEGTLKA